mgnify:FL=1
MLTINSFAAKSKEATVKKTFHLLILWAVGACTTRPIVQVSCIGELEDIIKKGDLATKAELSDFSNSSHLYAIGSPTNMKGHI